jgi:hypothetical protein
MQMTQEHSTYKKGNQCNFQGQWKMEAYNYNMQQYLRKN